MTQRQSFNLSLRLQGLSYRAIAAEYNRKEVEGAAKEGRKAKTITHQTVANDVAAALEKTQNATHEEAAYYRQIELQRLDLAMSAIAPLVQQRQVDAVAQWIRISESRRKLLGLDAPVQLQVEQAIAQQQDDFISLLEHALDAETFAKVAAVAQSISEASAAAATN